MSKIVPFFGPLYSSISYKVKSKGMRDRFFYDGSFSEEMVQNMMSNSIKEVGGDPKSVDLRNAWQDGFSTNPWNNNSVQVYRYRWDAPPLLKFINFRNRRRGLVMTFPYNDVIYVGWSFCNFSMKDKWNPALAAIYAHANAKPISRFMTSHCPPEFRNKELTELVQYEVYKMVGRALNYYQQCYLPL